jgi:chromosome segregation ATPase
MGEKIESSSGLREDIKYKLDSEIESLKEQNGTLSESLTKDREVLMGEAERLKSLLQEQEREHSEVASAYERDKALWEGKFSFLEQQRDQAKGDLSETSKKFESTLEQLQKRGSQESDRRDSS